jgi:TrmH family RNA methyltransferase
MTGAPHSSVKRYRDLARHPHRNGLEREVLLDGLHLLLEARKSGLTIESAAFEQRVFDDPSIRKLAEALVAEGADIFIVSEKTLRSMSPVKSPSGAVGIARHSLTTLDRVLAGDNPLVVVAHDIQDPGNVGGIVRTAEAAGATAVVATATTADPFGWKALRGSMGSTLRVPVVRADANDTVRACRAGGVSISALVPRQGESLFEADFRGATAILLGGEGAGIPADVLRHAHRRISIPMRASVESLNVGVAAALVLYEAFRQRNVTS